jgi:hypothetical protein
MLRTFIALSPSTWSKKHTSGLVEQIFLLTTIKSKGCMKKGPGVTLKHRV